MAFATQLPNVFNGLGAAITAAGSSTAGTGINVGSRATITLGNKPFLERKAQKNLSISNTRGWNNRLEAPAAVSAAALEPGAFTAQYEWTRKFGAAEFQPVSQLPRVSADGTRKHALCSRIFCIWTLSVKSLNKVHKYSSFTLWTKHNSLLSPHMTAAPLLLPGP